MTNTEQYLSFLRNKVIISESFGFEPLWIPELAKPHQKDICDWTLRGGRRAIFASFGLGKTFMQLINAVNCIKKDNKPFLIACPLGVVGEFKRDNQKLKTGYEIEYITDTDSIPVQIAEKKIIDEMHSANGNVETAIQNYHNELDQQEPRDFDYKPKIYLTNYERIRKGDIDPSKFSGVSFDEASILRNLKTETTNYILQYFKKIPFRFVATATPSPNDFIELLNYAEFLGVADRGHLLTRFFKRNSTKAGDLQLLPTKEKEFWQWVSTWAVFINKPSDLGYDDTGYDLPEMEVIEHCVEYIPDEPYTDKEGNNLLFKPTSKGLSDTQREKRDSISIRIDKTMDILQGNDDHFILWHHLEDERKELEKRCKEKSFRSVFGSQKNSIKEENLIDFSEGKYPYLITKPEIAGSGCNFQEHCFNSIFVGINYKFNDWIQAIHRILRYGQTHKVTIHLIFTQNETHVLKALKEKWEKHKKLQKEMIALVREYGLNTELIRSQMERQVFKHGDKVQIGNATLYNNDNTIVLSNPDEIKTDSVGLIVTSIPFGDHYEYSDFYNDYGHNNGNGEFFKQMDFLTPNLLRVLKPGHICAVHVKDRIRYSYQNGTSFTTIEDFSGQTVAHYQKHGFFLMGKITVTTDVVAENNQTYRLGYSEKKKDATKMGCGLPEYILLFRKAPTHMNNAYADEPVQLSEDTFSLSDWQLDAHSYWRSSGNCLMPIEDLIKYDMSHIVKLWKEYQSEGLYDFQLHKDLGNAMDEKGKLSRKFMTIPPISNSDMVWDDISRMRTLNAKQVSSKKEKHICLATGTLILTKRGYIPIQEIKIGDETLTHTGAWKKIIAKELTRKNTDVVQTKAQGVPYLLTTPDHKLYTRKHKGYRPSETFVKNDPEWVEAKDTQSHYLNQKLPPIIESDLSELDCWIIGRWLADGHIDHRGHQFFISVGNKKADEFEDKCESYIGARNEKKGCTQYGLKSLPENVRSVLFNCGKGAENKNLPVELISLNKKLSEALLLGYLSGDGHLDSRGVYHASSISRPLLLGLSLIAQRAWNIIPSVYASKKAGTHIIEGREVQAKDLWVMTLRRNGHHSFGKILEDGAWKKVDKVTNAGKSDVWNIRVEDDASYTAEGCIVKNCPLQLDIIERLINLFSVEGDVVLDPFGGLFSTPYQTLQMNRKAISIELNTEYYKDGLFYVKAIHNEINAPTLFDVIAERKVS